MTPIHESFSEKHFYFVFCFHFKINLYFNTYFNCIIFFLLPLGSFYCSRLLQISQICIWGGTTLIVITLLIL